jgi:hypothetical protein
MGLHDQGQVSRLMSRMQSQGLVENARPQTPARGRGLAKAWRLTPHGQMILDPYRGGQDVPQAPRSGRSTGSLAAMPGRGRSATDAAAPADVEIVNGPFRLTALSHQVLSSVANLSDGGAGPSNREIAHAAGVKDEGQASKLLARLQTHGLLENTGGVSRVAGNAWHLTLRGQELLHQSCPGGARSGRPHHAE